MSRTIKILTVFVVVFVFGSCSGPGEKTEQRKTKIFTDALQRQVSVSIPVKRIVSMAPNVTEMLFAIGLSDEIVGVTDFCDYPEAARKKARIGGYNNPNIEAILALTPDLIVATPDGYSKERIQKLDEAGMPVFLVNPIMIDEILEAMLSLGRVTGKESKAKQVVMNLRARVDAVKEAASLISAEDRPKVFYEIGRDPLITAGPGNFVDNLITVAGGVNIASDASSDWPNYSVEAVIMKAPDIIITASHTGSVENTADTWHRYRTIPAVQNNKIYTVDPDILLRPGPRIADGLEELQRLFSSR